jgi:hypothetical protein
MKANLAVVLEKPITVNPLTKLWRALSMSIVLKKYFPKWFKVVVLAAVQVLSSMEDERIFSTISFSKLKLRNCLSEHLAACVGIYNQKFFTFETFLFDKVYSEWHEDQKRQSDW